MKKAILLAPLAMALGGCVTMGSDSLFGYTYPAGQYWAPGFYPSYSYPVMERSFNTSPPTYTYVSPTGQVYSHSHPRTADDRDGDGVHNNIDVYPDDPRRR